MNLEKEAKDLEKKFNNTLNGSIDDVVDDDIWPEGVSSEEERRRILRITEIHDEANDARIARCEAKMREVGGQQAFIDLIESGKWSDSEDDEITEIEKVYNRLFNEQFHVDWFREHGKPYRIEDDPNAKF